MADSNWSSMQCKIRGKKTMELLLQFLILLGGGDCLLGYRSVSLFISVRPVQLAAVVVEMVV